MFEPHPRLAFASLDEQDAVVQNALTKNIRYATENSPFFATQFHGIAKGGLLGRDLLAALPVIAKETVSATPERFCAVEKNRVREYCATSGTTGKAVTIPLTDNDLQRLAYNEAQSFRTAGCGSHDVFQLMLTLDKQFMAGMAYYSGIRELRGTVIRTGPGAPQAQLAIAGNAGVTTLVCVPSFLLSFEEGSLPPTVRRAVCIGEPIRRPDLGPNSLAAAVLDRHGISLFGTYAASEMQTAFTDCEAGAGGHLQPDLLYVEILDEMDRAVPEGVPGEVTITTLGVEGMPLVRYRTGDIAALHSGRCSCGRSSPRLGPVIGRKSQAIKYKGTTLYPQAVLDILQGAPFLQAFLLTAHTDAHGLDALELLVHASDEELALRLLRNLLQGAIRVVPGIRFCSAEEIGALAMPAGARKMIRFLDKRKGFESFS